MWDGYYIAMVGLVGLAVLVQLWVLVGLTTYQALDRPRHEGEGRRTRILIGMVGGFRIPLLLTRCTLSEGEVQVRYGSGGSSATVAVMDLTTRPLGPLVWIRSGGCHRSDELAALVWGSQQTIERALEKGPTSR